MLFSVILGAGKSERFGGKKIYERIKKITVLDFSISKFLKFGVDIIVVAVAKEDLEEIESITSKYRTDKISVVIGGRTRWESFLNSFSALRSNFSFKPDDILIEHDAARPLFSLALLKRLFSELKDDVEGVVPFIKPVETVRILDSSQNFSSEISREGVALIQTPQVFRACTIESILKEDIMLNRWEELVEQKYSDLAGLLFKNKRKIIGIEGERKNIKITFKEDLIIADALVSDEDIITVLEITSHQSE